MELHEIRYFLALSRLKNFTRAAEACNVTQPALTRAIQKMEEELDGLLFSRERNNVHLTELGRLVEPHLTEVAARTEAARETAGRFLRLENAQLALGVMCSVGPLRFVGFLGRFKTAHPGVDLSLVEGVPERLCALLESGDLDVALMARPDGFPPELHAERLYSEPFVIACSAGHRFAQRNAVAVADLDGESYLLRMNCEYRDVLAEICLENGAALVRSFRSEREDWILTMVAAGLGVCFLPEYSASFPGVVGRPVISPAVSRDVCLVTVAGRRWSRPVEAFVKAVRRYEWPITPPDLSS